MAKNQKRNNREKQQRQPRQKVQVKQILKQDLQKEEIQQYLSLGDDLSAETGDRTVCLLYHAGVSGAGDHAKG